MTSIIRLETEQDVLRFVEKMNRYNFDIDVVFGHCIIDAKSILGVLGLGLGKELKIVAHTEEAGELENDLNAFYSIRQ